MFMKYDTGFIKLWGKQAVELHHTENASYLINEATV